jgi:hypothetical protein
MVLQIPARIPQSPEEALESFFHFFFCSVLELLWIPKLIFPIFLK